jgi:hypothetical protein
MADLIISVVTIAQRDRFVARETNSLLQLHPTKTS